jgi:thiosulfate dehydrogenase
MAPMAHRLTILAAAFTAIVYAGAVAIGLRVHDLSVLTVVPFATPQPHAVNWHPPHAIPAGPRGDSIRRGALLFNETPLFASDHANAKLSCASCHAEGGIQPFASPIVAVPALFPMFNERAGHMISLKDRIQECFVRSENGTPLDYESSEMKAIVDYIDWLSQPEPNRKPYLGRGLVKLPALEPNPTHGAAIYAIHCAGCHGNDGRGKMPLFPPLWGPESFNDGAGMNGIPKMAAFVQHNMPQNRPGILSAQDAYDVAAFIHAQPRPTFNQVYKHF